MSALAWLFGLGALTIAFPLLFHLIRRTPRGQTEFSSLMFLKPTPPTLTRRSRLENILLLLMRAAAIALIAFAFMRPFFRGADSLSEVELANRRVAILVDVSASMQRASLWDQAIKQIEDTLADLEPGDDVGLFTFDRAIETVVDFQDGNGEISMSQAALIRDSLKTIEPGWLHSDIGKALVATADQLDVWRDSQQAKNSSAPAKLQIVVVSDLQKGSNLDSLQSYQWPASVYVRFASVVPKDFTNATVQLLDANDEGDDPAIRVRVANSEESKVEQFFVSWIGKDQTKSSQPVAFYVPPGTSRVMKVDPDETVAAQEFIVSGDTEDFDNRFFVVPIEQRILNVAYIGSDDPDDPDHPQYYLRRALVDSPSQAVRVNQLAEDETLASGDGPTLVVLTSSPTPSLRESVDEYLAKGGTLAVVYSDDELVADTTQWTGARLANSEPTEPTEPRSRDDYQMMAEIDFTSQLFQPFANPRYNDFTKIRFWNHRAVEIEDEEATVLARFENGNPAVWMRRLESGGQVFAFASGWQPSQSQLALSTKFVPLVNGLVAIASDMPELDDSLQVGDRIEFPVQTSDARKMIKPDGASIQIEVGQQFFADTDLPGIYRLMAASSREASNSDPNNRDFNGDQKPSSNPVADEDLQFAVNVDRSESETVAIPIETIEMFEVKVGEQESAASELAQMREMRDRDIESSQKVWKWLIVAALILLIGEILLAGQTGSRMLANESSAANQASPRTLSGETT